MEKKIITITGAAGNIAYSLIFRILSGNIFPKNTKIQLNLLEIKDALQVLKGVKHEIEDCAFPNLYNIIITDNAELAFTGSDYILLVGAKPRSKGMQRADLLLDNANQCIFSGFCSNNLIAPSFGLPDSDAQSRCAIFSITQVFIL